MVASESSAPLNDVGSVIEGLFGKGSWQYVQNKHRGGENGQKGTQYEDYFASFLISTSVSNAIDNGTQSADVIEGQKQGFVDDVYAEREARHDYFQLKNSPSSSWGKGDKSIQDDFSKQYQLSTKLGQATPMTWLVCSDDEAVERLKASTPEVIQAHTNVILFEYAEDASAESMLLMNNTLLSAVAKVSRLQNCNDISDLAATLTVIKGVWSAAGKGPHRVDDLYRRCRGLSPAVCRVPLSDHELASRLQEKVKEILGAIDGFSYSIIGGFFSWEFGADSGVYPYDCTEPAFEAFQKAVIALSPKTFDALEGVLIP